MFPDVAQLEMFPYQSNPALFDLEYAALVSAQLPPEDVCYEQGIPYHEIMGWLFDISTAWYALASCTNVLGLIGSLDVLDQLERMRFKISSLFRDADDLEDTALDAFDVLRERETICKVYGCCVSQGVD